jgi:hypothetical protein
MTTPIPIYLGVEDELSEFILRRLLIERPVGYALGAVFHRGGFGYLRKQAPGFNNAAQRCPFLVLTDLDQAPCPPQLVADWLGCPQHPHFLLRVAVREVESWLLGDGDGLTRFLCLRQAVAVPDPEALPDPKLELLRLAHSSPSKALRDALVWRDELAGRYSQGPDYNGGLAPFVRESWNVDASRARCRSLDRLFLALDRLEKDYRHSCPP